MLDLGFWELILIMIVGLVVIGPKRLPRVAAEVGGWLGRMRRLLHQFRQGIQQELQAEELKEVLRRQQNEIQELRDIVQDQEGASDPVADAIERQLEERPDAEPGAAEHESEERRERD